MFNPNFIFQNIPTVGGIQEDTLEGILNQIENHKNRKEIESNLDNLRNIVWKIWIARWLVLAYSYPNYDSKKLSKMVYKVKIENNLTDKTLKYILEEIKQKEFIQNISHAEAMAGIHNLKILNKSNPHSGKPIKEIQFNWENPVQFLKDYTESEEKFNQEYTPESGKGGKKIPFNGWEHYDVIKDYGKNMFWIDLKTNHSKEEAENMGHCGTSSKDSTLISLRTLHGNPGFEYFDAHVTLVLSKDGYLTQIKGPSNAPVVPKYKEYIWDFIINVSHCIGTATGQYVPPGQQSWEESVAVVGSKEDLDYLLANRKEPFDFVDFFVNLLTYLKTK